MRVPESSFLLIAVALHAVLPLLAHVVPVSQKPLVAQSFRGETQIEIDLTPQEPLPDRRAPEDSARVASVASLPPDVRPDPRAVAREPSGSSAEVYPAPTSTGSPEAQPAPSSTAPPSGDTFDPLVAEGPPGPGGFTIGPGLGGRPAWALPGVLPTAPTSAPAPTIPPPAKEVDRNIAGTVLQKELSKKDKALGLDLPAAGTVASAIGTAVHGSDAPNEGRATFEVRLSPTGQVLGVRVVSASAGATATWERAARTAAQKLTGRSLTMTSAFAAGATVYVDVSSAVVMPDGSKTGGISRQGAGATFDVSNLGAHPRRVVRTNFRVVPAK